MKKSRKKDTALPLAKAIIHGIQEKKGYDIVCLNLTKINSTVCDYFIICHGDSHRQVEAIANSIEEQTTKIIHEKPWHREGFKNADWVLLDYVNVVAHVFLKETRNFYNLEGMWADAEKVKIAENGSLNRETGKKQKLPAISKNTRKKRTMQKH